MTKPLPTEAEIIARFHRLRITIGLSATRFGYASVGNPGIIKALEGGRKLHAKNKKRLGFALDELEREHSIPVPDGVQPLTRTKAELKEDMPSVEGKSSYGVNIED